jgi:peptidoglycan/LPS O-acetylase OafA/YrhL
MVLEKGQAKAEFVVNRISRIAPPYWLLTILLAALLLFMPHAFRQKTFSFEDFWYSMMFVSWIQNKYPIVGVGWTLSFEVIFYALVIVFYNSIPKIRFSSILTLILIIAFLPFLGTGNAEYRDPLFFLEFICGVLIVLSRIGAITKTQLYTLVVIILCVALFWDRYRIFSGAILGFALVMLGLNLEKLKPDIFKNRMLCGLGAISYSVYLLQLFVFPVYARLIKHIDDSGILFSVTIPIITILTAYIFYQSVELKLFKSFKVALNKSYSYIILTKKNHS